MATLSSQLRTVQAHEKRLEQLGLDLGLRQQTVQKELQLHDSYTWALLTAGLFTGIYGGFVLRSVTAGQLVVKGLRIYTRSKVFSYFSTRMRNGSQ